MLSWLQPHRNRAVWLWDHNKLASQQLRAWPGELMQMCAELRGNELCDGEEAGGFPKFRGLANQEILVCFKRKAPL